MFQAVRPGRDSRLNRSAAVCQENRHVQGCLRRRRLLRCSSLQFTSGTSSLLFQEIGVLRAPSKLLRPRGKLLCPRGADLRCAGRSGECRPGAHDRGSSCAFSQHESGQSFTGTVGKRQRTNLPKLFLRLGLGQSGSGDRPSGNERAGKASRENSGRRQFSRRPQGSRTQLARRSPEFEFGERDHIEMARGRW